MGMRTTAVEINPSVIAACRMWFRLPDDDARLTVLQRDAADYAADPAQAGTADVLCVDLYDHEAASPVLDSADFYRDCQRLLAPGGVMTVNLFGRAASFRRSARHIGAALGAEALWMISPTREGNTIVVAVKGVAVPERAQLAERAQNIETRFGLPAAKWLRYWKPVDLRVQADFSLDTSSSFAPLADAADPAPPTDSRP
jgi:spermidine synthase